MSDTVKTTKHGTEPALAAAALEALAALRKLGGEVETRDDASATAQLAAAMSVATRMKLRMAPTAVLDLLDEAGAVEYITGDAPPSFSHLGGTIITRIELTGEADDEALALLAERAAWFDPAKSWAAVGSQQSRALARALHKHAVSDDSGRAIGLLAARLGMTPGATSGLVKSMETAGYVKCTRNSRRTFTIELTKLVPRSWLIDEPTNDVPPDPRNIPDDPTPRGQREPEPMETMPELLAPAEDDEPLPVVEPIEIVDESSIVVESANANDVAFALLELVLARASQSLQPDHRVAFLTTELEDARHKLAASIEYSSALRRQLGEASDELVATKTERNTLRQRLTSVERNLSDIMRRNGSESTAAFREGVQHALNGIMREIPSVR